METYARNTDSLSDPLAESLSFKNPCFSVFLDSVYSWLAQLIAYPVVCIGCGFESCFLVCVQWHRCLRKCWVVGSGVRQLKMCNKSNQWRSLSVDYVAMVGFSSLPSV